MVLVIVHINIRYTVYIIKDPNKSNTQKYFRHSNVKRYELALLRSGYFFYFPLLYHIRGQIGSYALSSLCSSVKSGLLEGPGLFPMPNNFPKTFPSSHGKRPAQALSAGGMNFGCSKLTNLE